MLRKVDKVFIGKYIERDAALVDNATITTVQSNAVEGEVVILDSNYQVMVGASATYANSKEIYIAEGSNEVFTTVNPDGTSLTGRRLILSGSIDGSRVKNYNGTSYSAKVEAAAALPAITDTIVAGTEYVLVVVFKGDLAAMHPGQSKETYRYIAKTGDASTDVYDGLVAKVNKRYKNTITRYNHNLVNAVNNAGVLEITAEEIPSCNNSVDDIDEFVQNQFVVYLNYVDSDYQWSEVTTASAITYTAGERGAGTWQLIRDVEKHAQSYQGVSNRTHFPVIKPAMRVVKSSTYDQIVIEHDTQFRTPDNQYNKETSLVEVIALEKGTGAIAPQGAEVLATLNTWMASTPDAFANISF